ncbi:hypothetical protein R1flu_000519 [Riccia fluitans]|uniref:Fungal lipase-type domain-containing protein n=1 Tax=Riccia fluitans TaxID=41844 RepID=A0ABD1Y4U2_9MARC
MDHEAAMKEEPTLPAKRTEIFMVADPKTWDEHRGLFHYIFDLIPVTDRWRESLTLSDRVAKTVDPSDTWQARISVILLKLLWWLDGPMKMFGHFLEDTLNLFTANGGIFKTFFRLLFFRHRLVAPHRESENYVSFIGALDPRSTLCYTGIPSSNVNAVLFPGADCGSKFLADVLVMASKLAYENAKYVEKVVTRIWKMHFVGFYNCWNAVDASVDGEADDVDFHAAEQQKQKNTQVSLFTDRPKNARAIVVAFRGTEPFNAKDWSTDFDFSWFQIDGLGKVHVGFLEALGLGDRKNMDTFKNMKKRAQWQRTNAHHGSAMSGLPADVVADKEKPLAYDDVTSEVKKLMSQNPAAKLFVTGHSLGGALANMYTAFLFFNNEEMLISRYGALYTFGQPRTGAKDYSDFLIGKVEQSRYRRVVYGDDLVPRVPFDDKIFQFKHCGYCYYYNLRYMETTMSDAPNHNFFSWKFSVMISQRVGAIYDLILSIFAGWIYGPEYREGLISIFVRFFGLLTPGLVSHLLNNYVNAVRLGPPFLVAHLDDDQAAGLFGFFLPFRQSLNPALTADHGD